MASRQSSNPFYSANFMFTHLLEHEIYLWGVSWQPYIIFATASPVTNSVSPFAKIMPTQPLIDRLYLLGSQLVVYRFIVNIFVFLRHR